MVHTHVCGINKEKNYVIMCYNQAFEEMCRYIHVEHVHTFVTHEYIHV